jgi:hypothetical protein
MNIGDIDLNLLHVFAAVHARCAASAAPPSDWACRSRPSATR